jgi:hypothetical protein
MPPPFGPAQAGSPPVAGAGTLPGQPPFGASPLTMPTPNRGNENAARAAVRGAVGVLQGSLKDAGIGTPLADGIMKAIEGLSKLVKEGDVSPGAQNTQMQKFMMEQRQMAPLLAALAQSKGAGAGAGGPPAMPPGGPPMQPPSSPEP